MISAQSRVLMVGWEYPPHNSGGLGVACEGLTEALAGQNTQIYFTLPYHHPGALGHMNVLSCFDPSWEVAGQAAPFTAYGNTLPSLAKNDLLDADQLRALPNSELEQKVSQYAGLVNEAAKSTQGNFDVIHAHDWMTFPAAQQVAQQTKTPFVAHIHSTEFDRIPGGTGSHFIHHTEYEGVQAAQRVIAVSNYTKQLLIEKYAVPADKIDVVHNGVPKLTTPSHPGRHHFAPTRPVIVFMGRLTMQKGAEYFLQLATQVLKDIPEALFIVAGDGDMYRQLLFTTAYQRLSAHVLFTGFLRGRQREELLDRADAFIMPSLSEPFGLVALEAAQRHTPVIVSKTSGVSEVMPSAIVIDFWDTQKMSQTLVELLSNDKEGTEMAERQAQEVEKVTWDSAAEKVVDIYQQVSGQ